jgi:hypothetical protein
MKCNINSHDRVQPVQALLHFTAVFSTEVMTLLHHSRLEHGLADHTVFRCLIFGAAMQLCRDSFARGKPEKSQIPLIVMKNATSDSDCVEISVASGQSAFGPPRIQAAVYPCVPK